MLDFLCGTAFGVFALFAYVDFIDLNRFGPSVLFFTFLALVFLLLPLVI